MYYNPDTDKMAVVFDESGVQLRVAYFPSINSTVLEALVAFIVDGQHSGVYCGMTGSTVVAQVDGDDFDEWATGFDYNDLCDAAALAEIELVSAHVRDEQRALRAGKTFAQWNEPDRDWLEQSRGLLLEIDIDDDPHDALMQQDLDLAIYNSGLS